MIGEETFMLVIFLFWRGQRMTSMHLIYSYADVLALTKFILVIVHLAENSLEIPLKKREVCMHIVLYHYHKLLCHCIFLVVP